MKGKQTRRCPEAGLDDINCSYAPDGCSPMQTLHTSIFDGKDWQISEKAVAE